jgi:uncharacterized protein YbbK (DUF523 family)
VISKEHGQCRLGNAERMIQDEKAVAICPRRISGLEIPEGAMQELLLPHSLSSCLSIYCGVISDDMTEFERDFTIGNAASVSRWANGACILDNWPTCAVMTVRCFMNVSKQTKSVRETTGRV